MSLGRNKSTRFGEQSAVIDDIQDDTKQSDRLQNERNTISPASSLKGRPSPISKILKPRSLSQPSGPVANNKKPIRPRSDGDTKKRFAKRQSDTDQNQKPEDLEQQKSGENELVEFKSATAVTDVMKPYTTEDENQEEQPTMEDMRDNDDRQSIAGSDRKSVNNDNEAVKATVSGIPLRIRQSAQASKTIIRKVSPKRNITSRGKNVSGPGDMQKCRITPRSNSTPKYSTSKDGSTPDGGTPKRSATPLRCPSPKPSVTQKLLSKTISHASTISGSANRSFNAPDPKAQTNAERRTLETQFQTRKKRFDVMKKELSTKQKMVNDSYHVLVQLKKRLEESGKIDVVLEDLVDEGMPEQLNHDRGEKVDLSPEVLQSMKETINDIPQSLLEVCKLTMNKREQLLVMLERVSDQIDNDDLRDRVKSFHDESMNLTKLLDVKFSDQEKQVNDLVEKWQILVKNAGDPAAFAEQTEQLQRKIKAHEHKIIQLTHDLQQANHLKEQFETKTNTSEALVSSLKEKIKNVEQEIANERNAAQAHKEKCTTYEHKMKLMKSRVQDAENKFKDSESKLVELQKSCRQVQDQLKVSEHRWNKEKEDLVAKNKHDKLLLDKMTKERSVLEARAKTLEQKVEELENKRKTTETKLLDELTSEKIAVGNDKAKIEELEKDCESLREQLQQMEAKHTQLELKAKKAADMMRIKSTYEASETDGITTDKEAELYTELLATRVALKAAEDQIQNYHREKIRFIDSIQMLQGDCDKDQDSVAKTLVKNVETITELETKLVDTEDLICSQKIEIANLSAEIENLKQRPAMPLVSQEASNAAKENDLKMMLHEGKLKLEQSLKKSLDYEQKIIRYEHDLNRQSKQICEMENLLKVRDGLISMMKAKKDELQMENDSLNKYANEIRDLLIQAKEEARNRAELVQELTVNLDTRGRICQQLEKKVKELEGSLSNTNEKRFKLQDTIGAMEKELQSTKAHIISMTPEVQARARVKSNRKW